MKNRNKIIFWISTGLLSAQMLLAAGMYIFNHAAIQEAFTSLGFPTYLIYPMAASKILGVLVLWFSPSEPLREWAYAGFFFNFLLAAGAHLNVGDGEAGGAIIALVLLLTSYFSGKAMRGQAVLA